MHATQGFYKSEQVNELLSESAPYLTVPHPFTICLHRIPFDPSQNGKLFVLWNRHQSTIHHISMTKDPDTHNPEYSQLRILSVALNFLCSFFALVWRNYHLHLNTVSSFYLLF